MKSKILLSIIAVFFTFSYAMADPAHEHAHPQNADKKQDTDTEKHKQVVEDYKKFLESVPPAVREEIREYRKAVIKVNKEKSNLYKRLTQEAQDFLSKERQFKMKLPLKDSRAIATEHAQM